MQRLSGEQLAAGTSLGRRLVAALRAGRLAVPHEESFSDRIVVRIPAVAAEVGDLEIVDDGDEYTVYVGRHTHAHFTPGLLDGLSGEQQEEDTLEMVLEYVEAITKDEVVIWSAPHRGGGTFGIDLKPNWLSPGAQAWLWSGKPYQASR